MIPSNVNRLGTPPNCSFTVTLAVLKAPAEEGSSSRSTPANNPDTTPMVRTHRRIHANDRFIGPPSDLAQWTAPGAQPGAPHPSTPAPPLRGRQTSNDYWPVANHVS